MTHISIQNVFYNRHLGAKELHTSAAEGDKDETTVQIVSKNPPQSAEYKDETTVQNKESSLHHLEDRTLAQSIYSAIHHTEDRTIDQYADSALYAPAEQTTVQSLGSIPHHSEEQTICQQKAKCIQQEGILLAKPKHNIQAQSFPHNILRIKDSFSARFAQISGQFLYSIRNLVNFKGSNPIRQSRRAIAPKTLTSPEKIVIEVQPSQEEYQRVLRELDHCRLSFAQELARNGKLRDAIAQANKIPQTSRFFRDAQTLTRSWKQL